MAIALVAAGLFFAQHLIARGITSHPRLRLLLLAEAGVGHFLLAFYIFGILFRGLSNEIEDVAGLPLIWNWLLVIGVIMVGDVYLHNIQNGFIFWLPFLLFIVPTTYLMVDVHSFRGLEDFGYTHAQRIVWGIFIADLLEIVVAIYMFCRRKPRAMILASLFIYQTIYSFAVWSYLVWWFA